MRYGEGLKSLDVECIRTQDEKRAFFSNLEALRAFDVLKTAEFKFFSS